MKCASHQTEARLEEDSLLCSAGRAKKKKYENIRVPQISTGLQFRRLTTTATVTFRYLNVQDVFSIGSGDPSFSLLVQGISE